MVDAFEVLLMLAHLYDQNHLFERMEDWQALPIHKRFGDHFVKMHICF